MTDCDHFDAESAAADSDGELSRREIAAWILIVITCPFSVPCVAIRAIVRFFDPLSIVFAFFGYLIVWPVLVVWTRIFKRRRFSSTLLQHLIRCFVEAGYDTLSFILTIGLYSESLWNNAITDWLNDYPGLVWLGFWSFAMVPFAIRVKTTDYVPPEPGNVPKTRLTFKILGLGAFASIASVVWFVFPKDQIDETIWQMRIFSTIATLIFLSMVVLHMKVVRANIDTRRATGRDKRGGEKTNNYQAN